MKKKKRNTKLFVVVFLFLLSLSFFSSNGVIRVLRLKQKISMAQKYSKIRQQKIEKLKQKIYLLQHSTAFKEREVRQRLGYLKKNELSVEFEKSLEKKEL